MLAFIKYFTDILFIDFEGHLGIADFEKMLTCAIKGKLLVLFLLSL